MKLFTGIENWNKVHWFLFYLLCVFIFIAGIYYHIKLIEAINERRQLDRQKEAYYGIDNTNDIIFPCRLYCGSNSKK